MNEFERPKTAQEAVLREIRQRLLEGRLRPGEAIRPDKLGEELGVSAVPVREALRILEGEKQVFHRPHRGYIVTELDIEDLEEIFRIREILEAEAIRLAMPNITAEHMEVILDATQVMETPDRSIYELGMANRKFHFTFYEASEMPRLVSMINSLWDAAEPHHFRSPNYTSPENRNHINVEHRRIVDAIVSRDTEKMITEMHDHRQKAFQILECELVATVKGN